MSVIDKLFQGSIDMHAHYAPDPTVERRLNALQAAHQAQEAGMKKGDIIWAVGGHKVESIDDLKSYLATKYVGDRVQVKVLRDKKKTDLEVELGAPIQHGR